MVSITVLAFIASHQKQSEDGTAHPLSGLPVVLYEELLDCLLINSYQPCGRGVLAFVAFTVGAFYGSRSISSVVKATPHFPIR